MVSLVSASILVSVGGAHKKKDSYISKAGKVLQHRQILPLTFEMCTQVVNIKKLWQHQKSVLIKYTSKPNMVLTELPKLPNLQPF
jgi:hypothetical protein